MTTPSHGAECAGTSARTVWMLDLDNTLYPAASGLFAQIDRRILEYMATRAGVPLDRVGDLRTRYREVYGLTILGLMKHHGIDPDDYSRYVHDVPLADYLQPDPALATWFDSLCGTKVIVTNGSVSHAEAVLDQLGVPGRVHGVFDLAFMDYVPKPQPHGYRKLLGVLGADPRRCCFVDDLAVNLDTARTLGMATVLVGPLPSPPHRHVRSILDVTHHTAFATGDHPGFE